ncbi:MAG: DNA-processing protein DprA [Owenweeksia sp.]|nr:DNA-processing protein DprA [Owenweeksia sp.]
MGAKLAKNLIAYCGSAQAVFDESRSSLQKIPGIGAGAARSLADQSPLHRAERELRFIEKNHIQPLFYLDENYPERLKLCEDGPVNLYFRGNVDLNQRHAIAMVGTRNATSYGLDFCEWFIKEMKVFNPLVVSGLAYGIDVQCHKKALENGIPTVGVLGHGLDRIYPQLHTNIAREMEENGGLITEFYRKPNPIVRTSPSETA